jgi:CHAD domain-containing protein
MPYRLKSGETIPENVKRIAREEVESAARQLSKATAATRDTAIHEARKSLKKTRAILRLVRPELQSTFDTENKRLRGIGRRLSEFRDAQVMIETFDALKREYGDRMSGRTFDSIRRELLRRKRVSQNNGRIAAAIKRAGAMLNTEAGRVNRWPLHADGFDAIAPGLISAYRQGRKAMEAARKDSTPENAHEWRKRVKDHWYHVRLLEGLWTDVMTGYEKSLKDLETWLGEHHNLEVLREKLAAEPESFGSQADVDLALNLIAKYQKRLMKDALSLGERVYEERPRDFERRMRGIWDAWQSEPKSLKLIEKQKRHSAA